MPNQIYQHLIVTGVNPEEDLCGPLVIAREKALRLFDNELVSLATPVGHNFIQSFCIFPTGSGNERTDQMAHRRAIDEFTAWLDAEMPDLDYVALRWTDNDKPKVTHSHEDRYDRATFPDVAP